MMLVTETYPVTHPLNIESDKEISNEHLARIIANLMGSTESMVFDSSKPQGQPRRCPDLSKAKMAIGFEAEVSLEEGLKETVEWYLGRKNKTRIASERSVAQAYHHHFFPLLYNRTGARARGVFETPGRGVSFHIPPILSLQESMQHCHTIRGRANRERVKNPYFL